MTTVEFSYATGNDPDLSRVRRLRIDLSGAGHRLATYDSLGVGQLVGTALADPNIHSKQHDGATSTDDYPPAGPL